DGCHQFTDGAVFRVELDRHLGCGTVDHSDDVHVDLPGRDRRGPTLENLRPPPRPSFSGGGSAAVELACDVALRLVVGVGRRVQQPGDTLEGLPALRPAGVELLVVPVEGARRLTGPASGQLVDPAHDPAELAGDVAGRRPDVPG